MRQFVFLAYTRSTVELTWPIDIANSYKKHRRFQQPEVISPVDTEETFAA